ncbi:cytochrome b561 [Stutzerimonas stutzeri DSM 10701]|uniref:cytochrome b n=1 Tax=Stutzerimonas nitrititolerans TaxID=2482751 RepID=UPI00026D74E6|nr:cytochrome b [Stutzerimonas nitrititolerans]AFN77989.1 cytochrome b561 [Stutzerimonas stutzeri DSM 10701]SUD84571.1 cytochrome b561 [Stutzerimonas stutzeri]
MIPDSKERYGTVSKWFHWLMGGLIIWQFLKLGDRISEGEHWIGQTLVPWHVSIGALLMVLIVLRIFWASSQLKQRPLHDPATAFVVKAGHLALYVGMLLLPITGLLTMIGNGYGLKVFGVQLVAKGPEIDWVATLGSAHSPLAWIMVFLAIGHIGMALLHHFVKRDDVLRRML